MSLQAGVMQPEETRAMLCISGVKQNLRLLSRIVTDLDYQLDEHICSETETFPATDKCYKIVFATTDVPVHALETLRASPCVAGAKFVLIGGDASTDKISLELRQIFKFALFVQRPIKSSLLFVELQLLLDGEQLNEAITAVEESELKFTDKLKANYIGVLAQRIEALNQALISFTNKEQANNDVERLEAERLAHNMRGTASSFGLAALARTASDMEQKLGSGAAVQDHLTDLLGKIEKEAQVLRQRYVAEPSNNKNAFARVNVAALLSTPLTEVEQALFDESSLNFKGVQTAEEFINLAEKIPLDAVLIDLGCDAINGFELARILREHEKLNDLPIGFIKAANNQPAFETDCAHAGGSLVLQRPLSAQDIINSSNILVNLNENGRPRILLVDDDPDFTTLLASTLAAEGMIVKSTTNPLKAEFLLQEFAADLLIIDARMPEQSGTDLCNQLRANARWGDMPILFLTAENGVDARIKAYESGADDYLLKPLIVPELLTRVKGRLERAKMVRERMGKDALTGLLLRRSFLERLESALLDATRRQVKCSICLLDIDHFKSINDTYGHGVGDAVLSGLGRTLSRRFRADDIRGRWGGEEFMLAFPNTTRATIEGAVQRLLDEFQLQIFDAGKQTLTGVTFSAGIATFPDDAANSKELILLADEFLYKAKRAGRNQICGAED
jgi:diguanylate cyclase (GGDEF)-like protein